MKTFKIAVIGSAIALAMSAQASTLKMGTGTEKGNYYDMANDIVNYCGDSLTEDQIQVLTSSGSDENVTGLTNKQFSMGIVQEDVLSLYSKYVNPKSVNKTSIKVITPLHEEPYNLLIPKGYKPKGEKSSFFDRFFDDEKPQKIDINILRGQPIGAWGGSLTSAKALNRDLNLNADPVQIAEGEKVNMPILIVAGAPSAMVNEYLATGNYNLVPLDADIIRQHAPYFAETRVSYTMKGKIQTVPTVSVRALLVGKSFRNEDRNKGASELATCITQNLADLADDGETNANWESVYNFVEVNENQVDWSYFPLLNK